MQQVDFIHSYLKSIGKAIFKKFDHEMEFLSKLCYRTITTWSWTKRKLIFKFVSRTSITWTPIVRILMPMQYWAEQYAYNKDVPQKYA